MGFWSRILGGEIGAQDRYRDVEDAFLREAFGGIVSATGLRVTAADALTVPGVAACIQILSEDVAKVPLILHRKGRDGRRTPAVDHPLYRLLKEGPTEWLSSYVWRRALVHNALVHGNGYSRAWRSETGAIERITLLKQGQTTPRWADDGEPYFDVTTRTGVERNLSWQDVIHLPYRATTDGASNGGVLGVSPLHQNRETIALALAAERFAARFFANGARPSVVLEYDKKLPNDDVAARLRAGIERAYSGLDNAFKVAILELGVKLKEFSSNPSDSQMTETRKEQAVQCCTMYGVPPHKIGILDRATFSNIEHQAIDYVTGPVASLAEGLQSALEVSCLTPREREQGLYIELNLDGLMRGDIQSRYRAYAIGRQWGWLSADDVRSRENMDDLPDDKGKIYMTPLNMVPAGEEPVDRPDDNSPPPRRSSLVGATGEPLFLN